MTPRTRRALRHVALALAVIALPVLRAGRALAQAPTFRLLTFEVGASGPRLGSTRGAGEQDVVDVQNAILYLAKTNAPALRGLAPVPADMLSLIQAGPASLAATRTVHDAVSALRSGGTFTEPGGALRVFHPERSIAYLAPVPNPSKILGGAGAYQRKASDGKAGDYDKVQYPSFFLKPPSSLTGHNTDINLEGLLTAGVHEPEMAVVIGKTARNVSVAQAMDHVVGYTILNDVSSRDLPEGKHAAQGSMMSKGLDTFSPSGPYLTLKEDVPDPGHLDVYAVVDGVRHKWTTDNGNTAFLTFSVPEAIAYISERITLVPGDIVSTGVPEPTVVMKEGQAIEIHIEGLGVLRNRVVSKPVAGHAKFPPKS